MFFIILVIRFSAKYIINPNETENKAAIIKFTDGFNKTMNELTEKEIGTTHREKALNELLKLLKEEKYLD